MLLEEKKTEEDVCSLNTLATCRLTKIMINNSQQTKGRKDMQQNEKEVMLMKFEVPLIGPYDIAMAFRLPSGFKLQASGKRCPTERNLESKISNPNKE